MEKNKNKETDFTNEVVIHATEIVNDYAFTQQAYERMRQRKEEIIRLAINYLSEIGDFTVYAQSPNHGAHKYRVICYLPKKVSSLLLTETSAKKIRGRLFLDSVRDMSPYFGIRFSSQLSETKNGLALIFGVDSRGDLLDLCRIVNMPKESREKITEWSLVLIRAEHNLQKSKRTISENDNIVLLSEEEKNDDDEA